MSFSHKFDPTTLREYDIRGIVGRGLTVDDAFAIGRVFGSMVARASGATVARAGGAAVARIVRRKHRAGWRQCGGTRRVRRLVVVQRVEIRRAAIVGRVTAGRIRLRRRRIGRSGGDRIALRQRK